MAAMTGWAVLVLVIWWCAPRCTIASAEGWQQSRRAVRSRVKVWAGQAQAPRAISGPLTPVKIGLSRSLTESPPCSSDPVIGPRRYRFPS